LEKGNEEEENMIVAEEELIRVSMRTESRREISDSA
jgi:hypothetical protein